MSIATRAPRVRARLSGAEASVIDAHIERVRACYRLVIEDGARSGEFSADKLEDRCHCVFNAVIPFCHPQIVAERYSQDRGRQAALMAEFLVDSLLAR